MNKKWVGLIGLTGVAAVIVSCSPLAEGDAAENAGPGENQAAPAGGGIEAETVTKSSDVATMAEGQALTKEGESRQKSSRGMRQKW